MACSLWERTARFVPAMPDLGSAVNLSAGSVVIGE